jgi:N-methylhydantoinase B
MRLHMRYAGGGGYGAPSERVTEQIRDDIKNGYVTEKAARRDYGRS